MVLTDYPHCLIDGHWLLVDELLSCVVVDLHHSSRSGRITTVCTGIAPTGKSVEGEERRACSCIGVWDARFSLAS